MKLFPALLLCSILAPALHAQADACAEHPTHIVISSSTFSPMPGVQFHLRNFSATLENRGPRVPVCYEKNTLLSRGEIYVDNKSLTNTFSAKIEDTKTGISDLVVENGLDHVALRGRIKHLVPLNFTLEGPVTTDGTNLILNVSKIKADGIPIKGLLGLIGEHLNNVLHLNGVSGIQVTENTLIVSPEQIAHLKGHIASVQSTPDGIFLRYTPAPARSRKTVPAKVAANTVSTK